MFAPPVPRPRSGKPSDQRVTPGARSHGRQTDAGPRAEPSGRGWDFSEVPSFAAPRVQAKLVIGAVDDPLEQEADRVAAQVVRCGPTAGGAAPRVSRAAPSEAAGQPFEPTAGAPSPESFRGRGQPLPPSVRARFERRLGHDFAGVRLHEGPDATASAGALGARAYTHGHDIVLGPGAPSPGSDAGAELLAHELTHVVQQGAGSGLVQRSPLSDSVKDAWTAESTVEALLQRLSAADVQSAQADADVDAELARILAGRPDDLWVAQRIRKGQLFGKAGPRKAGAKSAPRPIQATFVRGATDRRALVIGGVHGSEQQGIDVATRLVADLQAQPRPPGFTTIIVPSLFPDNAANDSREGATPTNRNFPPPAEGLAEATKAGGGKPVDASVDKDGARTRAILPENQMLIELVERFHPERIISIHGTWMAGEAGVFYDPRAPSADEAQTARSLSQGLDGGQELPAKVQEQLYRARLAAAGARADQTDRDLALGAAGQIDKATTGVKGRDSRSMEREKEPAKTTKANKAVRDAHPSVAGNVGSSGALDNPSWPGGLANGISLGGYAPPRGISVFTVEPPIDARTSSYPNAKDIISGAEDKLSKADRITELQAYADAVRTILLGAP